MEPFPAIHKKFGFGMMRLPMINDGKDVDFEQVSQMVDLFLENGFNYFDTAHPYLNGQSEVAVRKCLAERHPRDSYILTNKLTGTYFSSEEEIRPFFFQQLKDCGVEYFDFYLMHAQSANNYPKFQQTHAYETAFALKEEGYIRHVGLSFHDTPEMLDQILTDHPQIEIVQLQFNYIDYENPYVLSKGCYDVCVKHGKPVIVMEPVKGGTLVKLPPAAQDVLDELQGGSNASYAIRFAASFDDVRMVLSGMSNLEQMEDNISFMKDFQPLTETEMDAVAAVRKILSEQQTIPCTACHYCVEENSCPQGIEIPEIFAAWNIFKTLDDFAAKGHYKSQLSQEGGKASDCIGCKGCESVCPQHLEISSLLQTISEEWD